MARFRHSMGGLRNSRNSLTPVPGYGPHCPRRQLPLALEVEFTRIGRCDRSSNGSASSSQIWHWPVILIITFDQARQVWIVVDFHVVNRLGWSLPGKVLIHELLPS